MLDIGIATHQELLDEVARLRAVITRIADTSIFTCEGVDIARAESTDWKRISDV